MKILATYMSGAGNLFTIIDNRQYKLSGQTLSKHAPLFCGITDATAFRTDGLLAVAPGKEATEFNAMFFNPDGTSGMMCGNGARCAIAFAIETGIIDKNLVDVILNLAGICYKGEVSGDAIRVYFPPPKSFIIDIPFVINGVEFKLDLIDVGSEHVVVNYGSIEPTADLSKADLAELYSRLRYAERFAPSGVNVNIYKVIDEHSIALRTYERGVEAETGACGTGALSAAVSAAAKGLVRFPVTIIPPSRSPLIVDMIGSISDGIEALVLSGEAKILFEKEIVID